jgi:hypothetical protein
MRTLSRRAVCSIAMASLVLLIGVFYSMGTSMPRVVKDYEDCAEQARVHATSDAQYSTQITHCGERFAGRRKPGGGYTYFDFMQDRSFDIAGPNPTEDERKQIDNSYMRFLGAQHEAIIKPQANEVIINPRVNQEHADIEADRQEAGPPLVLTPKIPLPLKRPHIERAKACEDGSLSCGWAKLSGAVRGAFASAGANNR